MSGDIEGEDAGAEHDRSLEQDKRLTENEQDIFAEYTRESPELGSQSPAYGELQSRRRAELHAAFERISAQSAENERLVRALRERDAEIEAIHRTKMFRYTATLRRIYGLARVWARGAQVQESLPTGEDRSYSKWVQMFDTIDETTRTAIRVRLDRLPEQPLVSILFPVYNTPANYLTAAIESVVGQIYQNWELCIADDCSTEPYVTKILAEYADRDPRIKVTFRSENGHISAASNTALEMANGTWIVPLDHDDLLTEHALALGMLACHEHHDPGVMYSDEDKVDEHGRRQLPYFKPDFDPLLLLGQNYLTHLLFFRRDLVVAAGGYRLGFEGSQDWDLILRVTERIDPKRIIHIPHVLYHWRLHEGSTSSLVSAKSYAQDAGHRAVSEHLSRVGLKAEVSRITWSGHNRIKWEIPERAPLVSIIIPTRDGALLSRCIDSILAFTSYANFEILVVDNGSQELSTLRYLRDNEQHLTIIRDNRPFNFSALNNAAVKHASGSVLCLLNDDTEVITEEWLDEMVSQLLVPGVGAVGAKLLYSDGRIQHGGVIVGIGDVAGHAHRLSDRLSPGYCGRLLVAQSFSAVTGACMAIRRQAWDEVGGLDEQNLAIAFNDVDLGLRLRQADWRVVWTPHASLYHHESVSRGTDTAVNRTVGYGEEVHYMQSRWGETLRTDPAYNPNLTSVTEDFALAWPPRVSYR